MRNIDPDLRADINDALTNPFRNLLTSEHLRWLNVDSADVEPAMRIMWLVNDLMREARGSTLMQGFFKLRECHAILCEAVPDYPELQESLDCTERALACIGSYAKRELQRRGMP